MNDTTIIVLISVTVSDRSCLGSPEMELAAQCALPDARYRVILMVVGAAFAGLTGQVVEWMRHLAAHHQHLDRSWAGRSG